MVLNSLSRWYIAQGLRVLGGGVSTHPARQDALHRTPGPLDVEWILHQLQGGALSARPRSGPGLSRTSAAPRSARSVGSSVPGAGTLNLTLVTQDTVEGG
ncbi:hypothetical protein RRG08_061053 [Elysia crispata]|uniref:Uncharacterized protein n=1 Tax=Elysia crispata TaxID=231223 RepID=A0AAE1E4X7_9GAST|nr:hypothetical protein RRG08_061053 [Elysia crispata]